MDNNKAYHKLKMIMLYSVSYNKISLYIYINKKLNRLKNIIITKTILNSVW